MVNFTLPVQVLIIQEGDCLKIIIGKGIDNLVSFGMTENEVLNAIGNPDKVYFTDNDNKQLQYYNLKLNLKLEEEIGFKLGWIEVKNTASRIFDINPWLISKDQTIKGLQLHLNDSIEFEDFDSFESYSFKDNWVELQYCLGALTSINFGYLYDEKENPILKSLK